MVERAIKQDVNAYLMRNHGVLCCGASVEEAVQAVEELEHLVYRHLSARISTRAAAEPQQAAALQRVLVMALT
jgi:L-fuculose-phosphate aldolase